MTALILPKMGMCENVREAIDKLVAMGARMVGSGHFSKVYRVEVVDPVADFPITATWKPLDPLCYVQPVRISRQVRIIKVNTRPDRAGLVVAKAAMATSAIDPLAPVYYGVTEFGNGQWIAEMEALTAVEDGFEHRRGLTGHDRYNRTPLTEAIHASPFLSLLSKYKDADCQYGWDCHSDNVMMRGSQPVVTDPMFYDADC